MLVSEGGSETGEVNIYTVSVIFLEILQYDSYLNR